MGFPFSASHVLAEATKRGLKYNPSSGDLRAARQFRPDVERQLEHEERLVAKKIVSGDLHFGREFTFINKDAVDLVRCLTASEPDLRYSVRQALSHPWISKGQKELEDLYKVKVKPLR